MASDPRAAGVGSPEPDAIPIPDLMCYRVAHDAMDIIPGRASRSWMDDTNQRFAYRCIPLSIANASGWEIVLPFSFSAVWNGGDRPPPSGPGRMLVQGGP
jgi:hypothetical protein